MSNKTNFNAPDALEEKGVIGLASDLVNIKKEYEAVAKYLLGRVMVVDTIDNAIRIERKYRYTVRIVTIEGEYLNVGGSISGGAFKNNSNLLGRRREIDEIEKLLVQLKAEKDSLDKEILDNRSKISVVSEEVNKISKGLQEQRIIKNTIEINLKQANAKKDSIVSEYQDYTKESDNISSEIQDINKNSTELNSQLTGTEDRSAELEQAVIDKTKALSVLKEQMVDKNSVLEEINIEIANLKQKHEFIVENINKTKELVEGFHKELENIKNNSQENSSEISSRLAAIENFTKEVEKNKQFVEMLKKESYMWNEYEITYRKASEMKNPEFNDKAEIRENIANIKKEMKSLGDVNINAIEEFKEINERYQFMKNQHADLMEAKENLLKIIDELEVGMRKQFKEKFEEIKVEFDNVFKELFGGGKGTIELTQADDILDAGINIISQPPGKKLQNMMQLSGGEKALTAISLLFAIQNLKPSPFCLLDEIEAALDGSNVVRFAEYLHKLTKNTQFIVITHRRGTMNCADRLYGITMQEKGISALVSVDLLENSLSK